MNKVEEAKEILKELQVPVKQQAVCAVLILLAMADIRNKRMVGCHK